MSKLLTTTEPPEKLYPNLPTIIAFDFDGTLAEAAWPGIGEPIELMMKLALAYRARPDHKLVLWTCRTDELLNEAVEFCKFHGLEFDAVNDNIPEVIEMFGGNARKIYADLYIDDKASNPTHYGVEYNRSW